MFTLRLIMIACSELVCHTFRTSRERWNTLPEYVAAIGWFEGTQDEPPRGGNRPFPWKCTWLGNDCANENPNNLINYDRIDGMEQGKTHEFLIGDDGGVGNIVSKFATNTKCSSLNVRHILMIFLCIFSHLPEAKFRSLCRLKTKQTFTFSNQHY